MFISAVVSLQMRKLRNNFCGQGTYDMVLPKHAENVPF
jgi:hypothetical protein